MCILSGKKTKRKKLNRFSCNEKGFVYWGEKYVNNSMWYYIIYCQFLNDLNTCINDNLARFTYDLIEFPHITTKLACLFDIYQIRFFFSVEILHGKLPELSIHPSLRESNA